MTDSYGDRIDLGFLFPIFWVVSARDNTEETRHIGHRRKMIISKSDLFYRLQNVLPSMKHSVQSLTTGGSSQRGRQGMWEVFAKISISAD